jgi:GrpB-like predicted nucleotidyltransferase (UPF0157 family)
MGDPLADPIPVELVPQRREWRERAQSETARLKTALGDLLVTVHHIGSTSIPDILAKPIVDLMPIMRDEASLDLIEAPVQTLGFDCFGEFGLPGRRYCRFDNPATGKREVQLHFYALGCQEIARHLAFRDYLRAYPTIAKGYEAEKIRAAALQPFDTQAYNAEKNDWISRVEREALAWAATRPPAP